MKVLGSGTERSSDAAVGDERLRHAVPEVVACPLRHDPPANESRRWAHAAREKAEPEAETGAIEIGLSGTAEKGFQHPQAMVLASRVHEILGRTDPWLHHL